MAEITGITESALAQLEARLVHIRDIPDDDQHKLAALFGVALDRLREEY